MTHDISNPSMIRNREQVHARVCRGQYFNEYERADGNGWIVAIGPITDFLPIDHADTRADARDVVGRLRAIYSQPALTPDDAA